MKTLQNGVIRLGITLFLATITLLHYPLAYADLLLTRTKVARVLVVCGHAVDCERAKVIMDEASDHLYRVVNLRIVPIVFASMPHDMTGSWDERLGKWLKATNEMRKAHRVSGTVVFISAFPSSVDVIDFHEESVFGVVTEIGVLGRNDALALVKMAGSNRIVLRVTLHEIGHLLGAWHTSGMGLMADSTNSIQHADSFAPISIQQMKNHIEKMP